MCHGTRRYSNCRFDTVFSPLHVCHLAVVLAHAQEEQSPQLVALEMYLLWTLKTDFGAHHGSGERAYIVVVEVNARL